MNSFAKIIIVFILIGCGFVGYHTLKDFQGEFFGANEETVTTQARATPPSVTWNTDEKIIIKSLEETCKSMPTDFLRRLHDIRIVELSPISMDQLKKNLGNLGTWDPLVPRLSQKGDLLLKVELHKSEDSMYLFYAIEELRNRNRIFEISDQRPLQNPR